MNFLRIVGNFKKIFVIFSKYFILLLAIYFLMHVHNKRKMYLFEKIVRSTEKYKKNIE
jgi:hypothetical protein